jgi:hypothetical protein
MKLIHIHKDKYNKSIFSTKIYETLHTRSGRWVFIHLKKVIKTKDWDSCYETIKIFVLKNRKFIQISFK